MCVVSYIGDMGRTWWPQYPQPTIPGVNVVPNITFERVPTKAEWDAFLELVEKARKFDEISGQPDCEDPEKTAWFTAMQDEIDKINEAVDELIEWKDRVTG